MYKSPIEIIQGQIQTQLECNVLKVVRSYGINVDKEELIRALNYERCQYSKGYLDGKADAMEEIVRCKDCKYRYYHKFDEEYYCKNGCGLADCVKSDDFCPYGERKDNEGSGC